MAEVDVVDGLVAWFTAHGWGVEVDDESTDEAWRAVLTSPAGDEPWPYMAVVLRPDVQVALFGVMPEVIPASRIPDVAEAVTRANCGLLVGSAEMDLDEGETRVRTGVWLGPHLGTVDEAFLDLLLGPLTAAVVELAESYLPAFADVAVGDATPAEAIAAAEAG